MRLCCDRRRPERARPFRFPVPPSSLLNGGLLYPKTRELRVKNITAPGFCRSAGLYSLEVNTALEAESQRQDNLPAVFKADGDTRGAQLGGIPGKAGNV